MTKKGQSVLEFLMTYGWTLLVVLAVVASLAYFGVLEPGNFVPQKCQMPSGIGCIDFIGDPVNDEIILVMQNAAGFDFTIVSFTVDGCTDLSPTYELGNPGSGIPLPLNEWQNSKKVSITLDCNPEDLIEGEKIRGDILLTYQKDTALTRSFKGELILKP